MMEILVYGAGVLGSLYAARLRQAGFDVSILARGQRLAEIEQHGIILEDQATGRRSHTRVRAVSALAPEDRYDLVVVLVRKDQLSSVLPALTANRHTPDVLFMVNNAAGPDELIHALGRERVILGFPGAGGARTGPVVQCMVVKKQPTTIGELDGSTSPRIQRIVRAFSAAGFPVAVSRNMDAWLKSHVALISPIANSFYVSGDNYRLARDRQALGLMLDAMREGFRALEALGVGITPGSIKWLAKVPNWLLVPILRRSFSTKRAELVMARHAAIARTEMKQLADELMALVRQSGTPAPALERLYQAAFLAGDSPQS